MAREEVIRSRSNADLKRVRAVRAGKEPGRIVLEGRRLIDDARRRGLRLELVLVAERLTGDAGELAREGTTVRPVEESALASVSALTRSPGWLALADAPEAAELPDGRSEPRALVLVVDGVADPGNLGALARTAEAAGASAIALVEGGVSPWNEKALRGSMGSLLRLPVARFPDAASLGQALRGRGFRCVRAATRGGRPCGEFDWSGPIALWVSSEVGGAEGDAGELEGVTLPMRGEVESLNVAVAGALLLYAAGRAEDPAR